MLSNKKELYESLLRQRREDDEMWIMVQPALKILDDELTYEGFLSSNPTPRERKVVEDCMWHHLRTTHKGKIIPGFNDK